MNVPCFLIIVFGRSQMFLFVFTTKYTFYLLLITLCIFFKLNCIALVFSIVYTKIIVLLVLINLQVLDIYEFVV